MELEKELSFFQQDYSNAGRVVVHWCIWFFIFHEPFDNLATAVTQGFVSTHGGKPERRPTSASEWTCR